MRLPRWHQLGTVALGATFAALVVAEQIWPLRRRTRARATRWTTNAGVALAAAPVTRLLLLPLVVGAASSRRSSVGRDLLAVVALDGSQYVWHRLNHRAGPLWRFHVVHHTDPDLDASTAVRFHFGELLLAVPWQTAAVRITGASQRAVLIFELVFAAATAFHHSNLRLPEPLDRALTWLVVTPRMHGVHHSVRQEETDANWGTILTLWDRIGRSLRLDVPQEGLTIGAPGPRWEDELPRLLALPLERG